MFLNDEESELKKTKTSENFNKKMLSKKRQFSNDFFDPEALKDFTRFTDIININTFGSQPIVMYKKIKRMQSPIEQPQTKKVYSKEKDKKKKNPTTSREKMSKNPLKNNYISDGGLPQKVNKYKGKLIKGKSNHSQSPSKKIGNIIKSKTNRDKYAKQGKTQKAITKTKEYIPKTFKENNYKQKFKKEKMITQNSYNPKKIEKNMGGKENNKYMTDKNTIEQEEKKKNENIKNLIKNVVNCFKKEYIANKKKSVENKKITDKKKDYINRIDEDFINQQENGIVIIDKSEDKSHFKIKKIKPLKKMKIEKLNTNNINNINNNINYNLFTDNDKFLCNNLTSSNNYSKSHELSKILIKSKITQNNNLNSNIYENIDNNLLFDNKKKYVFKPQINQFEFLEKIRDNFKKIKKLKKEQKDSTHELINDSFRFNKSKKYKKNADEIPYNENDNDNEKDNKDINNENDEFLYADRVTHRTRTELDKFLKKKKLEKKKEQKEEFKKKQEKIMNTLQNLIRLGEQCKSNNSPHKNRNDSKNHLKQRKVANEYYVGTEESKNNTSTFVDKQEYYKSIIESKNVLINSKIEKTESNLDDIKFNNNINNQNNNNSNAKNIIISNSMVNNKIKLDNYFDNNNYNYINKNNINKNYNDIKNNYNNSNYDNYKDNKLDELKSKIKNTIKRSNEIFNKENIKRIKSDLSDNNNLIKTKFENQYFNNFIDNKQNIKNKNNIIDKTDKETKNKLLYLQQSYNRYLKKVFWKNLKVRYAYMKTAQIKRNKKIAFDYLIAICKISQFKKIQEYNEKMKTAIAIKNLFMPFIHNKFLSFCKKSKNIYKIKNFEKIVAKIIKNKIFQKLRKYFTGVKILNDNILPATKFITNLLLKKYFAKIKNANKKENIIFNNINNINNDINLNSFNNINKINNNRSYLSKHYEKDENKANSYIYESLECDDSISVHPNSVDNDGLHQLKELIEMQNENRYEENLESQISNNSNNSTLGLSRTGSKNSGINMDSFNSILENNNENSENSQKNENKIKTEIHLKEHLLQQIINSNQTSSDETNNINNKKEPNNNNININEIKEDEKKEKDDNLILTKINDEKENDNNNDIFNNKKKITKQEILDNLNKMELSNKKNTNEDIINIIENNSNENTNKKNTNEDKENSIINENNDNKNLESLNKIIPNINDKNKFADELTDYILSKILIEKEIKSPENRLFPKKTGDFNFQKYNNLTLQSLINNNSNNDSNNALDSLINLSLSDYGQNNSQILEKSMILQYSLSSEFNKTIKDKKNCLETNLYNDYIIEKLILLICKEIKLNYARIYDNISIPYKANYEQVLVASYLQDNELLNNSYKELKVKEDLKNIINKKKIIEKFNAINKKIRKLKGLDENNSYDNLINECIIDATIEIINKERPYGESGEPFPFSKREREICFKYNRNDPKPLMRHVYKSLKKMLFEKGNIIKENSPIFDKNDPFLMNIFKKEMENENIWNELEIQEEQVKSIASNVIFDQLINEVIEILEHVQLNRKKPELYQNKSIYACDEIPRLSFQMLSNNTEDDEAEADFVCH